MAGRAGEIGWDELIQRHRSGGGDDIVVSLDRHGSLRRGRPMIGVAHDGALRIVVPSMGKHSLRVVVALGGGNHAEATEHCVGLPAAEELDGLAIDSSTEESSGAAGAETAARDGGSRDPCLVFDGRGTDAESIGEGGGGKFVFPGGVIEVVVEAVGVGDAVPLEVKDASSYCSTRA